MLRDPSLPDHDAMTALARKEHLTTDEINTLITYAVDHGGIDYAYSVMADMRRRAISLLEPLPDTPEKRAFISLISYIIDREH